MVWDRDENRFAPLSVSRFTKKYCVMAGVIKMLEDQDKADWGRNLGLIGLTSEEVKK